MAIAKLPQDCTIQGLAQSLGEAGAFEPDWQRLVLRLPETGSYHCGALAFLCDWGLAQQRKGRLLFLEGGRADLLADMALHEHLGLPVPAIADRRDSGQRVPLRLIANGEDVFRGVNAICDLILRQFPDGRNFVPSVEWATNEIVDNVIVHAESPVPGCLCAQHYPDRHRLEIAVCDLGRGIKASLEKSRSLYSHGQAIETAVLRGVTRDAAIGQGNGMAGALEIATQNGGDFRVWSGDVVYRFREGNEKGFEQLPKIPGTGVVLGLDTRRPVDLRDTWIAPDHDWSYLDAEAERLEQEGLSVASQCSNTGTRAPAQRLRRKILALLPDVEGQLVLNFAGARGCSSSFLDELLGRLALELGLDEFGNKIAVVGLSELDRNKADVVLRQRLESQAERGSLERDRRDSES